VTQNLDPLPTGGAAEADSLSYCSGLPAAARGHVNERRVHDTTATPDRQVGAGGQSVEGAGSVPRGVGEDTRPQPRARPLDQISVADSSVLERLDRLEALLNQLVQQRAVKDWYTTAEAAQLLGRAEFTVREWCRLGRVHAQKRRSGRGRSREWVLSHAELLRIQREGLLPLAEH
jgi:hypothetical protein